MQYFILVFIVAEGEQTCAQKSRTGSEINSILPCIELPFKLFPFTREYNAMNVHILESIFDLYLVLVYNHKSLILHCNTEVCYSYQITEL